MTASNLPSLVPLVWLPVAAYCLRRALELWGRTHWAVTTGKVVEAVVRVPVANARMQPPFDRILRYRYWVEGRAYEGAGRGESDDPLRRSLWTGRQWDDEYRPGQSVQVWYDRRHPERSALTAAATGSWLWGYTGVGLALTSVVVWWFGGLLLGR